MSTHPRNQRKMSLSGGKRTNNRRSLLGSGENDRVYRRKSTPIGRKSRWFRRRNHVREHSRGGHLMLKCNESYEAELHPDKNIQLFMFEMPVSHDKMIRSLKIPAFGTITMSTLANDIEMYISQNVPQPSCDDNQFHARRNEVVRIEGFGTYYIALQDNSTDRTTSFFYNIAIDVRLPEVDLEMKEINYNEKIQCYFESQKPYHFYQFLNEGKSFLNIDGFKDNIQVFSSKREPFPVKHRSEDNYTALFSGSLTITIAKFGYFYLSIYDPLYFERDDEEAYCNIELKKKKSSDGIFPKQKSAPMIPNVHLPKHIPKPPKKKSWLSPSHSPNLQEIYSCSSKEDDSSEEHEIFIVVPPRSHTHNIAITPNDTLKGMSRLYPKSAPQIYVNLHEQTSDSEEKQEKYKPPIELEPLYEKQQNEHDFSFHDTFRNPFI
eukprot:TRINITY_DN307_c0_g1_i1.p1 TRINITY_DN307_c0_g1~~TRINITY_DN307_c0_g1_i1.p1  ORF type:complete len:434 (+),score=52.15 TRINITY_DN307_c0_g1_i1:37-1338(+)